MQIVINLFGGFLGIAWTAFAADYFTGARRARSLADEPPYSRDEGRGTTIEEVDDFPFSSLIPRPSSLSVVLAACNEEEKLPRAFRSLLAQEYPGEFQIVAVDDRSTDATPGLLDALAKEAPEGKTVTVLHIEDLPEGWLGKTHALYQGAQKATGRWILFTDADVVFAPDCLSRAVHFADRERLHHLVSFFRLELHGFWEHVFGLCFSLLFVVRFRPWHVRNPKMSSYLGVGGFNMVRRDAYEAIGTHRAIALEVADDMELGRRIKRGGFTSEVIGAADRISVRWQEGLQGLMGGLTKNAYAGLNYSWTTAIASSTLLILNVVWPFAGLFLARRTAGRIGYGAAVGSILAIGGYHAKGGGIPPAYALTLPLSSLMLIYVMVRSAYVTERNSGITWRGTFYPLPMLREAAIPPPPPPVPATDVSGTTNP